MRKWTKLAAVIATVAGTSLIAAPVSAGIDAESDSYCGITWGSLPKSGGEFSTAPVTNVRAGRHECYDRLVVDIDGPTNGFEVWYDTAFYDQGGQHIPLRGGAILVISLTNPAYDEDYEPTYDPANPREIVNVAGYRTFRQAAWGGSYEGYSSVGLGVRARLPFRVFSLAGPGGGSRVVIDVAHKW